MSFWLRLTGAAKLLKRLTYRSLHLSTVEIHLFDAASTASKRWILTSEMKSIKAAVNISSLSRGSFIRFHSTDTVTVTVLVSTLRGTIVSSTYHLSPLPFPNASHKQAVVYPRTYLYTHSVQSHCLNHTHRVWTTSCNHSLHGGDGTKMTRPSATGRWNFTFYVCASMNNWRGGMCGGHWCGDCSHDLKKTKAERRRWRSRTGHVCVS